MILLAASLLLANADARQIKTHEATCRIWNCPPRRRKHDPECVSGEYVVTSGEQFAHLVMWKNRDVYVSCWPKEGGKK